MPNDELALPKLRPGGGRVRFGVFELDRVAGDLFRKGQPVKLAPQPMAILIALVNKAGREVTREELAALWPEGTFVDFEAGIGSCVRKIRVALGDSAENPMFVKTLHGRGFCFIAAVQLVFPEAQEAGETAQPFALPARAGAASAPTGEEAVTEAPPSSGIPIRIDPRQIAPPSHPVAPVTIFPRVRTHRLKAAAIVLGMACAVTWAILRLRKPNLPPVEVVPLTSFAGDEYDVSLSPDGGQAVFSWAGEEDSSINLYIKQVDGNHSMRRLTTDPGRNEHAAWSPDGGWIAFNRNEHLVMIVSPLGGTERQVATSGGRVSWTPDSKEVVFTERNPGEADLSVHAVSIASGQVRQVLPADSRMMASQPFAYSPDARYFAFVRSTGSQVFQREASRRPADLYVKEVHTGLVRRLTDFKTIMAGWTWMPDSREILFCSKPSGQLELLRVGVERGGSPAHPAGASDCESPDASRYAAAGAASVLVACNQNTYVLNLQELDAGSGNAARRVLSSTRRDAYPRFSADGRKFVFVSDRSGMDEIWMAETAAENAVQVTSLNRPAVQLESPDLSPDGSKLLFLQAEPEERKIVVMPVGQGVAYDLRARHTLDANPSWSRDGRSVYFASRTSGAWQLYKMPSEPGAAAVQLTSHGGTEARESADGRAVYFLRYFGQTDLWTMPTGATDADAEPLIRGLVEDGWWAPTATGIYFVDIGRKTVKRSATTPKKIYFFDFATRRTTEAGSIQKQLYAIVPGFTASPTENHLLYTQMEFSNIDIVLLKNFR
jgi:Tol biopolymer transport system component/DNA-binding winged helix-turn-helix (wHTH) protein